ncbi:Ubiquitin carboxyl-terminal hydrolase 16 [Physocladia obscura]|uniref:Ubiquitin carboxyl-terminal hydrolase n=1 Tax=Physocladia obscura TaxID=109957 RepID=A0AAD5SZW6_9FUNG|nr:Ubiquitin carboxyl-terminal hydrolase 16 [Physocladia obscura]
MEELAADDGIDGEENGTREAVKQCRHLKTGINIIALRKAAKSLKKRHSCAACALSISAAESLWLCLQCGAVHCGRNDNNHAELHAQTASNSNSTPTSTKSHALVFNQKTRAFWCYTCDEWLLFDNSNGATKNQLLADVLAIFATPSADTTPTNSSSRISTNGTTSKQTKWLAPIPGLSNLGNTCFFNSVIQSLAYTVDLNPFVTDQEHPDVVQKGLTRAFLNLLNVMQAQLALNKPSTITPQGLFTQLKIRYEIYRSMSQQDAHELLRTLMDGVKEEQLKKDENGRNIGDFDPETSLPVSFVDSVFGGKLVSVLLCATCRGVSYRFEEFLDLSMSISDGESEDGRNGRRSKFNPFSAIRSKITSPRATTPASSRASSPYSSPRTLDLDRMLDKLNSTTNTAKGNSDQNMLQVPQASSFPPLDQLTHDLFRPLDTAKILQGAAAPKPQGLTLANCIENFLGCDVLEGENGLVCDRCNAEISADPAKKANASPPPYDNGKQVHVSRSAPIIFMDSLNANGDIDSRTESNGFPNSDDDEEKEGSSDDFGDSEREEEPVVILDDPSLATPVFTPPVPANLTPHQSSSSAKNKTQILTSGFKRYLIHTFPKNLVFHLKRFERISKLGRTRKVDTFVSFDEIIDIGMYLSPDAVFETVSKIDDNGTKKNEKVEVNPQLRDPNNGIYRLYAVVVHAGSLFGGHYVSFVRIRVPESVELPVGLGGENREIWCCISDTSVKIVKVDDVLKQQAYLLFYEHV